MLKIIGIVLIIGSFTGIGMTQRQGFRNRIVVLGDMLSALDILSNELSYHLTSIPDIAAKLAQDSRPSVARVFGFLQELIRRDDNLSLSYKWMKAFRECGQEVGLTGEDIGILCDLSEFIGKYDVQAQLKSIRYAESRLSQQLELAADDMKSKGNVYRTCCVAAGILLVLVLI